MNPTNPVNVALAQMIKVEHYRWHSVERWPDSSYKDTVLAAVHSALARLETSAIGPFEPPSCSVCASRKVQATVLMFPSPRKGPTAVVRPAA